MDKRVNANGLVMRLMTVRDIDLEVAAPIAAACYPHGTVKPNGRVRISKRNRWRESEAFVDFGVGSIDTLYVTFFGVDVKGYFGGTVPTTSDDAVVSDFSPLARAIMTGTG